MNVVELVALAVFGAFAIAVLGWVLGRLQGYRIGEAEAEWRLERRLRTQPPDDVLQPPDADEGVRVIKPNERKRP